MRGKFSFQKKSGSMRLFRTDSSVKVCCDETESEFQNKSTDNGVLLEKNGKRFQVHVLYQKDREAYVWVNGKILMLGWVPADNASDSNATDSHSEVHAIMPGRVVKLHVKQGDLVDAGTPLLVLEAMKMENEIKAQGVGKVLDIIVQEGASVEAGALLIKLDPMEEP